MIEINNLTAGLVDESFLKRVAEKVLKGERVSKDANLSIALVGQKRIMELNKKYRRRNRPTDVLAFGQNIGKNPPTLKKQELGEIIICRQQVKKNSKKFNLTFKKELARVLIHGILHILGYDHEKPSTRAKLGAGLVPHRPAIGGTGAGSKKEAQKMEEKQEYYFSRVKF